MELEPPRSVQPSAPGSGFAMLPPGTNFGAPPCFAASSSPIVKSRRVLGFFLAGPVLLLTKLKPWCRSDGPCQVCWMLNVA